MSSSLSHRDIGEKEPPSFSPRIAIIREEFLALTHNPLIAALLNQLVYWSQRTTDFDRYLKEECEGRKDSPVQYGWFYKTTKQLLEETMLDVSPKTLRRYRSFLVSRGWIEIRPNPKNAWDKTGQYRVNLRKLSFDLQKKGLAIPGITISVEPSSNSPSLPLTHTPLASKEDKAKYLGVPSSNCKNVLSRNTPSVSTESKKLSKSREGQNAFIEGNRTSYLNGPKGSVRKDKTAPCNTETTTKTINKEKAARARSNVGKSLQKNEERDSNSQFELMEKALQIWKREFGQEVEPSPTLEKELVGFLSLFCRGDLSRWKSLCVRASESSFLKGEGKRGWRMTLEWLLIPQNSTKVLEGKYDDPETLAERRKQFERETVAQQKSVLLETIADPLWKDWCALLAEGTSHVSSRVTLSELKVLAKAQFAEFDGRLVWIHCPDMSTLRCVETYRFPLITIAQSRFPKARNIRTEIKKPSQQKGKSHG